MNNVSSLVCASTAKALTSKAFEASAIKGGYNAYTFESSTGKCNIGRMPPYIYYNSDPLQEKDGLRVDKCMPKCKILNDTHIAFVIINCTTLISCHFGSPYNI